MAITREKVACVVFGAPKNLPKCVLPTFADVMKADLETRQEMSTDKTYPTFAQVAGVVSAQVKEI